MFSFFSCSQNINKENLKSLHDFKAELINGDILDFSKFKGNISIKDKEKNEKKKLFQHVKDLELYKNVIEKFSDAKLANLTKKNK